MPFIGTQVNFSLSGEQKENLKRRWDKAITLLPGKSAQWLMAGFEDQVSLHFQGDESSPAAFVEVKIYGGVDAAASGRLTAAITEALQEECGIAPNRIYVAYQGTENWGWNGRNF